MNFLTTDDYKAVCDELEFSTLQADEDFRLQAEQTAIEQIKSYCRPRYDMDTEFAKTGTDRHPMLIQCTVNIALWIMHHRLPSAMGAERRREAYDDTIDWLKQVQLSKASPTFQTYDTETETDTHNPVAWGSQKQTSCTW